MAKKTKTTEDLEFLDNVSPELEIEVNIQTHETEDPLADKVRDMRAKGFDNNRIASLLGTTKQIVDSI